jgi:hypothetical protein
MNLLNSKKKMAGKYFAPLEQMVQQIREYKRQLAMPKYGRVKLKTHFIGNK